MLRSCGLSLFLSLIAAISNAQTLPFTPPPLQGIYTYATLPVNNLILGTPAVTSDLGTVYWNGSSWQNTPVTGGGSVTSASVVSANGFAGTVDNPTTSPAITLMTSASGLLKGSSGALIGATAPDVSALFGGASGTGTLCLSVGCAIDLTNSVNLQLTGIQNIATGNVLANFTGSPAPPSANPSILILTNTSGGILYGSSSSTVSSSAVLEAGAPLVGGGTAVAPYTLTGTGALYLVGDVETVSQYLPGSAGGLGAALSPGAASNTAIGTLALNSISSGINDTGIGANATTATTTGNANTGVGPSALQHNTTGGNNTAVGASAIAGSGSAAGTGGNNTGVGSFALTVCQGSCGNNTAVGASALGTLTTGTGNTAIGYLCQASAVGVTNEITICGAAGQVVMRISGAGNPATSIANFFGNLSPVGHLISAQTALTASNLSSCGTTPAINATATDVKGTITEGTSATGCILTFATAYATAPDCTVTSPSGNALTSYSTSTTALTLVNASLSGVKYSYTCVQ
jgi:hypothetical protein